MEITPFDLQKTEEEIATLSAEHDALKSTLDRIHTLIDLRESRLKNIKKHTTITSLRRKRKYILQRDIMYQMLLARRTEGEKKIASVLTTLSTLKERITYEQIKNKYRANIMKKTEKILEMRQVIANSNQRLLRYETQQANRIADLLKALRKKITQRYLFSLLALLPVVVCMELLTLQVNALTQGVIITIEWVLLFVVAYIVWLATMSESARALMQRYIMLRDTPLHDEYLLHYQKQIDLVRAELVEKQKELDELEAQQAKDISDAVADTPETCGNIGHSKYPPLISSRETLRIAGFFLGTIKKIALAISLHLHNEVGLMQGYFALQKHVVILEVRIIPLGIPCQRYGVYVFKKKSLAIFAHTI